MANKGEIEMSKANEQRSGESIESLCSGAKDATAIEANVQGTAIADFLRQCASIMRENGARAVSRNYLTDAAYCTGSAIVLEMLAQRAEREGWSRTPPVP